MMRASGVRQNSYSALVWWPPVSIATARSGYVGLPDHDPKVVGAIDAHLMLRWVHRVFANLKRWALGTFHSLRCAHLRRYLDAFVFRWNRRRHTAAAFDTLLGFGARLGPDDQCLGAPGLKE